MRGAKICLGPNAIFEKWVVTAVLLLSLPQVAQGPTTPNQRTQAPALASIQINHTRQNIDPIHTNTHNNFVNQMQLAAHNPALPFELDVAAITSPVTRDDLNTLMQNGRVEVTLPNQRTITLTTHAIKQQHGSTVVTAASASLLSTFTLRGQHMLGTLATQEGVYRITNSQAWSHKQLNYRLTESRDFVAPPSKSKGMNHVIYSG